MDGYIRGNPPLLVGGVESMTSVAFWNYLPWAWWQVIIVVLGLLWACCSAAQRRSPEIYNERAISGHAWGWGNWRGWPAHSQRNAQQTVPPGGGVLLWQHRT